MTTALRFYHLECYFQIMSIWFKLGTKYQWVKMHFFQTKGHALYMYKDDLELLKIHLYFSKIFSKNRLAMDAETCVEESSGHVDSSFSKIMV